MQKIEIKVYGFRELSNKSREKALNELRYINTDYVWWDFIYEDFISLCKTIGIGAEAGKIYFRGFYSQGDGSAFDAPVNIPALAEGMAQGKWKEYSNNDNLLLPAPAVNKHVLGLIKTGVIDTSFMIKSGGRGYYIKVDNDYDFVYNKAVNYKNITAEMDKFSAWVEETAKKLNRFLYISLRDEYEYRVSDKAVEEAIEANDYLFMSDGKLATRLLGLVEEPKD